MYVHHLYGWYNSYNDIKRAIKKLYAGGYSDADISIITKDKLFNKAKTFVAEEAGNVYVSGPLAPAICYNQNPEPRSLIKVLKSLNFFDPRESDTAEKLKRGYSMLLIRLGPIELNDVREIMVSTNANYVKYS